MEFGHLSLAETTTSKVERMISTPGDSSVRKLLQKSKTIGPSLLSQRIARRASITKNVKLLLTPELFRQRNDSADVEVKGTPRRQLVYGVTNHSRSEILQGLYEYRKSLQNIMMTPASFQNEVTL